MKKHCNTYTVLGYVKHLSTSISTFLLYGPLPSVQRGPVKEVRSQLHVSEVRWHVPRLAHVSCVHLPSPEYRVRYLHVRCEGTPYVHTPAEGSSDSESRARSYYITLTPIHWYFLEHWLEVMSETLCVFSLHPNLITDTFWRHWTSDKKRFNEIMVWRF